MSKKILAAFLSVVIILTAVFGTVGCQTAQPTTVPSTTGTVTQEPTVPPTQPSTQPTEPEPPEEPKVYTIGDDMEIHGQLEYDYSEAEYALLLEDLQALHKATEEETVSYDQYRALMSKVDNGSIRLSQAMAVAQLFYYSDLSNEDNSQLYQDLTDKSLNFSNELNKLIPVVEQSIYKRLFFGPCTEEEVQRIVEQAVVSDEKMALENEITSFIDVYYRLTDTQLLGTPFDTLYGNFVEKQNALAKINGYSNFLEDSFENDYFRDYGYTDVLDFANLLSQYMLPMYHQAQRNANEIAGNYTHQEATEYLRVLYDIPFYSEEGQALLSGFYQFLGEEYYDLYRYVLTEGYYYITDNSRARQGAYTSYLPEQGEPYMYFSTGDYVGVFTFVHEFGHYCNAYYIGFDGPMSYDLAEVHSQGAEWLFLAYLEQLEEYRDGFDLILSQYVQDSIHTILTCATVATAEVYIYTAEKPITSDEAVFRANKLIFTNEEVGSRYANLYKESNQQYFRMVCFDSAGYYNSYSTALIASMLFYAAAQENFDDAVDMYGQLLVCGEDFVKTLESIGLSSPFDDETYLLLMDGLALHLEEEAE